MCPIKLDVASSNLPDFDDVVMSPFFVAGLIILHSPKIHHKPNELEMLVRSVVVCHKHKQIWVRHLFVKPFSRYWTVLALLLQHPKRAWHGSSPVHPNVNLGCKLFSAHWSPSLPFSSLLLVLLLSGCSIFHCLYKLADTAPCAQTPPAMHALLRGEGHIGDIALQTGDSTLCVLAIALHADTHHCLLCHCSFPAHARRQD